MNSWTLSLLNSLMFFICAMVLAALSLLQGRIPEGFPPGFASPCRRRAE
jgi:hypothetical protein